MNSLPNDPVIVAAKRTAIGSFGGSLATLPAHQLGAAVMRDILEITSLDPNTIDEVILGQVLTCGTGQNPARQAALAAGLPDTTPCMTINKVCGSGLKSVALAAAAIMTGDAQCIIAGGQENMSLAPHYLPKSRNGQKMGEWALQDSMITDGLWDAMKDYHMGVTAENLAEKYDISREAQDAFAVQSQTKAAQAQEQGVFKSEITPIMVPQGRKKPDLCFEIDEYPRPTTTDALAKLRPAFKPEGTVTAGNASGINDGAAIVLVTSETFAQTHGLPILGHIQAYASAGVAPEVMGYGPVPATEACLKRAGWSLSDLERIEANEAFAAQALSVAQGLNLNMDMVNVNGGAIALGHPIGASGARILVTLLHEMQRADVHKGLATLCIGGGQGIALAVHRK